jgi:hypothetical protein
VVQGPCRAARGRSPATRHFRGRLPGKVWRTGPMPLPAGPQSHRTPRDALGKSANPRPGLGPGCSDMIMRRFTRTREIAKETDYSESSAAPGPDSESRKSRQQPLQKGKARDASGWVTSRLKFHQLFSTRGHNISRNHFANSGGQVCCTSPTSQTSASSPFSTLPNFQISKVSSKSSSSYLIWHTCPFPNRVSALVPPLALPRRRCRR